MCQITILNFSLQVLDSDLVHFLDDVQTFWEKATFTKFWKSTGIDFDTANFTRYNNLKQELYIKLSNKGFTGYM